MDNQISWIIKYVVDYIWCFLSYFNHRFNLIDAMIKLIRILLSFIFSLSGYDILLYLNYTFKGPDLYRNYTITFVIILFISHTTFKHYNTILHTKGNIQRPKYL